VAGSTSSTDGVKVNVCRPATGRQPLAASGAGDVGAASVFVFDAFDAWGIGDLHRSHFQQDGIDVYSSGFNFNQT
jgi:hypothetical protein